MAGTSPAMTESIFRPSLIVFPRRSNRFAASKTSGFKWAALFLLMFARDSAGPRGGPGALGQETRPSGRLRGGSHRWRAEQPAGRGRRVRPPRAVADRL